MFKKLLADLVFFLKDIKLLYTFLSLPFLIISILLALKSSTQYLNIQANKTLDDINNIDILLIFLCLIFARSFAMGINRVFDAKIDKINPRTNNRLIPKNILNKKSALIYSLSSGMIFLLICYFIENWVMLAGILVLAVLAMYTAMKHIHWSCHYYLGCCHALVPMAVSVTLLGYISKSHLLLAIMSALWIASQDIIYAISDRDFDLDHNLNSIPAKFGQKKSYQISIITVIVLIICSVILGLIEHLTFRYYLGLFFVFIIISGIYIFSKKQQANFVININNLATLLFLLFFLWDYLSLG